MNRHLVSYVAAAIGVLTVGSAFAQGITPPPPGAAPPPGQTPTTPVAPGTPPGPATPRAPGPQRTPAPAATPVAPAPGGAGAGVAPAPGPAGAAAGTPTAPLGGGGVGAPAADGFGIGGGVDRPLPDRPPPDVQAIVPEPGGLTSDEVVRRAMAVNAPIKVKRAQLRAAEERITQTMWQFFPKLTATASYTRVSKVPISFGSGSFVFAQNPGALGTNAAGAVVDSQGAPVAGQRFSIPPVVNNYALVGRISIPVSDYILRISDAAASSKAGRNSARYSLRAQEFVLDLQSRSLYFNWLRTRGQAEIAAKSVERVRARLEDARTSFQVGVISKGDLLRIEAQVASTEARATSAASGERLVYGQLAIIMRDWHPSYKVGEGIPLPQSIPVNHEPVDKLIHEAQTTRMEMKAVDEQIALYRHGASATRVGALPRVDVTGDVTYANPNPRYFPPTQEWNTSWSVGAAATWTLGDTFINSAAARELEAEAEAAEASRIDLRANLANEVLTAYLDLGRARDNYAQQLVALAAAEEGYRVTTDLFRAGRATGTNLIDSENDLLDAKLGEINARIDLTIAAITLKHATGRDIPSKERVVRKEEASETEGQ